MIWQAILNFYLGIGIFTKGRIRSVRKNEDLFCEENYRMSKLEETVALAQFRRCCFDG